MLYRLSAIVWSVYLRVNFRMLKPNPLSAVLTRSYFKSQIYNFVTVSFGVQVGWNNRAECQLVHCSLYFRCCF